MEKRRVFRAGTILLCAAALVSSIAIAWSVQVVGIAAILSSPKQYDGEEVQVCGEAYKIKNKVSKRGNLYTTFRIKEIQTKKWLRVFSWGTPILYHQRYVCVTGIFKAEKRVGRYTFKNEIEAKEII